jgi:lipoprotein NlpD
VDEQDKQTYAAAHVIGCALLAIALAGCASQKPAPVVDRSGARPGAADRAAPATVPPPIAREARDGVYTVQRGDTLYSIALAFGVDVRDLARWNGLADASQLRVGQSLRVTPPPDVAVATVTPVAPSGSTVEVRPLPAPGASGPPVTVPPPVAAVDPKPDARPETKIEPLRPTSSALQWQWPAAGSVVETFDDPRNKGVDIGGNEGASVLAAADGEVVYVGSAVRGYGNLVIIRHSEEFITAYGHNRKILVAERQQVKRGQQIAELGRSDADRPKLHFEIRHQGKPVDPLRYLPSR